MNAPVTSDRPATVVPAAPVTPLSEWHRAIAVNANEHTLAENKGLDAFIATCADFAGIATFGPTRDAATAQYVTAIRDLLASATESDKKRMVSAQALVQFNHRITSDEKLRIAERAEKAGLSVRQFVLNQCLYAQIYTSQPGMPDEIKRELLGKIDMTGIRSR